MRSQTPEQDGVPEVPSQALLALGLSEATDVCIFVPKNAEFLCTTV